MKIVPMIVTTWEALVNTVEEAARIIYVDANLMDSLEKEIGILMDKHHYKIIKIGKQGVFYSKSEQNSLQIYDPLDIL